MLNCFFTTQRFLLLITLLCIFFQFQQASVIVPNTLEDEKGVRPEPAPIRPDREKYEKGGNVSAKTHS